jgi:hypothetical protein
MGNATKRYCNPVTYKAFSPFFLVSLDIVYSLKAVDSTKFGQFQ